MRYTTTPIYTYTFTIEATRDRYGDTDIAAIIWNDRRYDGPDDVIEAVTGYSHFDGYNPIRNAFVDAIENAAEAGDATVTIRYAPAIVTVAR